MLRYVIAMVVTTASWPTVLNATESPLPGAASNAAAEAFLTIDSSMLQLLNDARTRPAVEKHLPRLAKRLMEDQEAAEFVGSSSPRELAADSHVRGITAEILNALQADLLAAQKAQ